MTAVTFTVPEGSGADRWSEADVAPARSVRSPSSVALIALAGALLGLHGAAIAAMLANALHLNVALIIGEGFVYAAAVWLVLRRPSALPVWCILAVAFILRLTLLFLEPYHSTDIYRYVWEGRIQAEGFSPYLHVPADPALAHLRDDAIWSYINRADYAPTIYPPVAQAIFFAATRVAETVVWMKAALLAFEALAIWAILKLLDLAALPRTRVLLYAWCPLPAWEFAEAGHVDAVMIAFTLLAILASRLRRDALAGIALAAAVLVKFFPLVLMPALWRRWDWKAPAAFAAAILVGYLPHLIAAGPRALGFLPEYAGEEGISDASGFWLARLVRIVSGAEMPSAIYFAFAVLVLACIGLWTVARSSDDHRSSVVGGLVLTAAAMLLLSPQYPWYFAWIVPFLCFAPSWPLLWLVTVSPILYWDAWRNALWNGDLLYGGTFALLFACAAARAMAPGLISPSAR